MIQMPPHVDDGMSMAVQCMWYRCCDGHYRNALRQKLDTGTDKTTPLCLGAAMWATLCVDEREKSRGPVSTPDHVDTADSMMEVTSTTHSCSNKPSSHTTCRYSKRPFRAWNIDIPREANVTYDDQNIQGYMGRWLVEFRRRWPLLIQQP